MISNNLLVIAGEVTSKVKIDVEKVALDAIKEIGYSNNESGFDVDKAIILTNIDEQSKDIAMGVNQEKFVQEIKDLFLVMQQTKVNPIYL